MRASIALGLSLLMTGLVLASHCVTPVKVVKVLDPIIAVPIVDYHYAIGDEYRIKRIVAEVVQGQVPVAPASAQGSALDKGIFGTVGGQGVNLDSQVLAIFNESCIQCHKPGASKPGVQLFTEERGLFVGGDPSKERARRARIVESVDEGDMPKGGARLPEEKRRLLRKWAQ